MLTVFRSQVEPESVVIPDPASIVVDCSGDPLIVRQEEAIAADVNRVVAAFEASGRLPQMRPVYSGERDYDVDLHSALQGGFAMRDAWLALSPKLKERYPTMESWMTAISQLTLDLKEPEARDRRAEDAPRSRRSSDKTAAETAALSAAVDAAVAKRSAAEK